MTTLTKFQQSELKRFDEIFEMQYKKEVRNFISSAIEKAFALGKEEEAKRWINQPYNQHDEKIRNEVKKEILAGLPIAAKQNERNFGIRKGWEIGFNQAISIVKNLIKKK